MAIFRSIINNRLKIIIFILHQYVVIKLLSIKTWFDVSRWLWIFLLTCYSISEISVKRMLKPLLNIQTVFKLSKLGRRHAHCLKILHGFTNKVIAERKNEILGLDTALGSLSSDEDASIGKSCLINLNIITMHKLIH